MSLVMDRRRTPARTRRRARFNWGAFAFNTAMVLTMVSVVTFLVSSLVGNTMLEKSRRERIRMQERAQRITAEVSVLRRNLDELTSMSAVDQWASSQGMILSGVQNIQSVPKLKEDKNTYVALAR